MRSPHVASLMRATCCLLCGFETRGKQNITLGEMDAGQLEARKARARQWFESLRDDICAAFEALEEDAPASLYGDGAARFVRTPWTRTDHGGAPGGGGVMSMLKGRLFEKVGVHVSTVHGEFAPGVPRPDSRRRDRSAVLGLRHLADRPSDQPQRAGGAHEHALRRHHQGVVRRRRRSHPGARSQAHPGGCRHRRLPCRHEGGLRRQCRGRHLREIQEVVRRVFLSQAPQRDARHRRHLLRLSRDRLGRRPSPSRRTSAAPS